MYNQARIIDTYQLNVNHLSLLTTYYRDRIGLDVLEQGQSQVILGVDNYPLFTLKAVAP